MAPEPLEAPHLAASPGLQVPTAHHPIQNPQTWRDWPQEQVVEVGLHLVSGKFILCEGRVHLQSAGTGGGAGRPPGTGGGAPEILVGTGRLLVLMHREASMCH